LGSIRKDILFKADPETVWAAVRDVGEVHRRLVPNVLVDARLEHDARVVTFANGTVIRELIVDIDDVTRRFVYAAVGGRSKHHNASMQVFAEPNGGSRLVWITDVLPNEAIGPIAGLMEQGAQAMARALDGTLQS
jgi:hypothetical protein